MTSTGTILSVKDLKTRFHTDNGTVRAVDGVSFDLKKGETLGIVGESGSGKSALGLSIMRLIHEPQGRVAGGKIEFDGLDLLSLPIEEVRKIRGKRIAMIFQDPMTALNPFLRISTQLTEVTRRHLGHTKDESREHAKRMLKMVGIPNAEERVGSFPHEFSGGMRQRVMIAIALSCDPDILIADEPTTALDVTIQAQILELIKDLRSRMDSSVILITHDLGVVAGMTDRVIVMYAGRVFEQATTKEIFERPANPYTVGLLKSVPDPSHMRGTELYQIPGLPPDLLNSSPGCPFAERCGRAEEICRREFPPMIEVSPGHNSLCHFANDVYKELGEETSGE